MQELDRRTRKTRKAISDAFWRLMQEKSFEDITISDITEAADIHRATFYLHYQDKYDWLQKCVADILSVQKSLSEKAGGSKRDSFVESFAYFDRNYDRLSLLLNNMGVLYFQETYINILVEYFRSTRSPGATSTPDSEFAIHFAASAIVGSVLWWIRNDRPLTPDQMADKMILIYQGFPGWLKL